MGNATPAVGGGKPSDASLLRRLHGGQADAASILYMRYAVRIRRLAEAQLGAGLSGRLDPEDIVQSVFRTFFRRTKCGQYDVPEGGELWKLLLIISLNKIRATARHHRADKRDVGCTSALGDHDLAHNTANEEESRLALRMTVDELLGKLPAIHKEIILQRIDGQGVAEIAAGTRRAKRTVERVLQNFRSMLANLIREEYPELAQEFATPESMPE
jgi:RNA polymerase sigma-70 factor (ECF subfamily)